MRKKERKKRKSWVAVSWMIGLLTTREISNNRRIKGLVYQTCTAVIFIGSPKFLGRGEVECI